MNKKHGARKFRSFFLLLVVFLTASAGFSQDSWLDTLPAPTGQVNDFAGVMDPVVKQQLETRLREFKQKTNPPVDIAVAIVDTTGDRPIFDYSLALARKWKIGSKDVDNPGALLFIAVRDRKYFTQISKDLEDELPDGLAGQLQRQYLVPEFKQGNYSKGIADTIDAYIRTIEAKQTGTAAPVASPTPYKPTRVKAPSGNAIIGGCICLGLIIVIIVSIVGRRGRGGRGGGWGGGGSDIAGNVMAGVAGAIIGNMLSGGGSSSSGSSSSDWGGSSGGGNDWGGFGGGGDFGGGGSGGDW